MGDVIFNGSEERKPVGRSEVTILFDNEEGLAPEKFRDYTEISVTRRLYRSGESEYLINKTPCRLMDIRELVMDTGIAGRSYSIVEQGRVEEFITASPAERRIYMEEAAGIVRYKTKRIAAERKLEQTRQNAGMISTRTVNSSSRPSSMPAASSHFAPSGRVLFSDGSSSKKSFTLNQIPK